MGCTATTIASRSPRRQARPRAAGLRRRYASRVYPGRYDVTHLAADVPALDDAAPARIAGRVVLHRSFGKLAFAQVQDRSGGVQVAFALDELGEEQMAAAAALTLGTIIGVDGYRWTTRKGEPTIRVTSWELLAPSLTGFPDKWAGVSDPETLSRKRYLQLVLDGDARERFKARTRMVHGLREFLVDADFMEVETPMLQAAASGAAAKPFVTRHEALGMDLYLRIAPETYLKRLVAGGMDRVFEIGKNFRNEGTDPSHLQEFTMLEWYAAYWDFRDNMTFTRELIQHAMQAAIGTTTVTYEDRELDFGGTWPELDYRAAVAAETGIDLSVTRDVDDLAAAMREIGIEVPDSERVSFARLADALYKRTVRPKLVDPVFLINHPAELVPLARRNDDDGSRLDMFQVVANGWELAKGYSELVDPEEQRTRLEEQATMRAAGDEETMMFEPDFIEAMEFGMPPMSGVGVGIDRLIALITDARSLRDVVFFPQVRRAATD